jgi:hypothetical protein
MKRIDKLSQTAEFRALSARQQFWLRTYIESGSDAVLATQAAYDTEGENARTFGYQVLRNNKIKKALRVFLNFGKSKRTILLEDLKADIEATKPGSVARARLRGLYNYRGHA